MGGFSSHNFKEMLQFKYCCGAVLALFLLVSGCKKDVFEQMDNSLGITSELHRSYDQFGKKLERAISQAIINEEFKYYLIKLTQKMEVGDYEVLLTDLMEADEKAASADKVKDILLAQAEGLFSEAELDDFMMRFPSVILGVRGNYVSWAEGRHVPPIAFVSSGFKESQTVISGSYKGEPVEIDLTKRFDDAVIAIRLSERHYLDGRPALVNRNTRQKDLDPVDPCSVIAPSTCPEGEVSIVSFNATAINGAIVLSYQLDVPPTICPEWVTIIFTRENLDGSTHEIYHNGGGFPVVYDYFDGQQGEIFYQMRIVIALPRASTDPEGGIPETPVICQETYYPHEVSAQLEGGFPRLYSFNAENIDENFIAFNWQPPGGEVAVDEYRLRFRDVDGSTGSLQVISTPEYPEGILPGNTLSMEWEYPEELRGKRLEAVIEYRAAGNWVGTVGHDVLATHRSPGEPLFFYGIEIPEATLEDIELNETGENLINGYPELRIIASIATEGGSKGQTSVIHHSVEPLTKCVEYTYQYPSGPVIVNEDDPEVNQNWTPPYWPIVLTDDLHPGWWYSVNGPVNIHGNWDNELIGRRIKFAMWETDALEINFDDQTQGQIETEEHNAQANSTFAFGKWVSSSNRYSFTYDERDAELRRIKFPKEDHPFTTNSEVYYESPQDVEIGNQFRFGGEHLESLCDFFAEEYGGE